MIKIDFNEILNYGLRSQLAYTINQLGWDLTAQLGWRTPTTYRTIIHEAPKSEVNVIVEVDDVKQIQWIAVRGSSNLRNWKLNFNYLQRTFSRNVLDREDAIDLHTGFYLAAEDVYQSILPHLNKNYQTRLTGHSLGGAIAVILMMFLFEDGYQVEKCITFGQPKVTDFQGAEMCQNLPLLRIINDRDVVPLLPPGTVLTRLQGGYHHFGERIVLQDGQSYNYTQTIEAQDRQDQVTDSFWMSLLQAIAQQEIEESTENIKDHNLNLYLLNIISNIESREPALESLLCNLTSGVKKFHRDLHCL
jgi:triacylglycerol lipase